MTQPDPKPEKRIRNSAAILSKMLSDPTCRGCRRQATEGHHIIHRSLGGDDVRDNIMPLCSYCHRAYHDGVKLDPYLEPEELMYVGQKMGATGGAEYLARRYGYSG